MRNIYKLGTAFLLLTSCNSAGVAAWPSWRAGAGNLTIEELLQMPQLAAPALSPDGATFAFTVSEPTLDPKGKTRTSLWMSKTDGSGEPWIVTNAPANPVGPRFSPDGKWILVVAGGQAWNVPVDGGAARQITNEKNGVGDPIYSPNGKMIAYSTDVNTPSRVPEGVQAKIIDNLLFRHWTEWRDSVRTGTFITNIETGETRRVSAPEYDAPGFSLGGPTNYAFSNDNSILYYTQGAEKDEALSTDFNLYSAPVSGGAPKRLTPNKGWDGSPEPSPDGKWIAYRSQATYGFESERFTVQLYDTKTGATRQVASDIDRWVDEILWAPDSKSLLIGAEDLGTHAIWRAPLDGGKSLQIIRENITGLSISPDGRFVVGRFTSLQRAGEIVRVNLKDGSRTMLTHLNDGFFKSKKLGDSESVWIPGAKGVPAARDGMIQGWLVTPPNYMKGTPAPFILMIHGGPQQSWLDGFGGSGMWNPQIYAAQGYVVLALNPHGSTGFGQELTNEISGDWGGAVYEDCMNAADWAIANKYADPERMAAIGASFGGYMVNWILGHTDRFKAIVCHAGVYNLDSMWGVTEELWFPEWELKGRPWDSAQYREKSPHVYAKNFKTPTLVTHGEIDYRVPIGEGIQLFSTLQRLGVPSRFVYFPDEGHWLLKARNRELWLHETFAWLNKYVRDRK
ncbi:MAG: S9 family peptidase [Planctomycetes bacterium]|nr:S9 family peptidase [Planctomycetota bacterium]